MNANFYRENKKLVYYILAGLLVVALLAIIICSLHHSNEIQITLYSCMETSREDSMMSHLKEKFPDYEFVLQHYSTGDCGTKLMAEGKETDADIVVGLQCAILEMMPDLFSDVSGVNTAEYTNPAINPNHGRYWIWEKYDGGIVVNTEILEQEGLPEPTSYEDLLNPVYKGWIVMPSAAVSGAGYMFLNNWYNLWGEDGAFQYVDELQTNVSQFVNSGHSVTQFLLNGEDAIGLVDLMNVYRQIRDGAPLKIIIPETGAPYNITGTGIIAGKDRDSAVIEVYSYLMNEYVVFDNSNFSPGGIFADQTADLPGYPSNIPMADMKTITDNELKEYLSSKWKY